MKTNEFLHNVYEWQTSCVEIVGQDNSNYIMSIVSFTTYADMELAKASATDTIVDVLGEYYEITGGMALSSVSYRMYDAMLMLLEAATRAGCNYDSDKLVEAMLTINDLDAMCGTIDLTQGDREPAKEYMNIIYDAGYSQSFDKWLTDGGYDAFKAATGRSK